jgi:hypothetical protein
MILRHDDNPARRRRFHRRGPLTQGARQRRLAGMPSSLCRRRFTHPRQPTQFDERGYVVVDTCECLLLSDHDDGCVCEHDIERRGYRVDADGREHYATRPHGGTR